MRSFIRAGAFALAALCAVSLGGCVTNSDGSINWGSSFTQASNNLNIFNAKVNQYAPIVGKDLIAIGNIIYQVECSPAMAPASQAAANVLSVLAPNSTAADKFQTRVQENDDIAAQLCPLVATIKVAVGNVPQTATPAQVIAPAPAS